MSFVHINGRIVEAGEARVGVRDRGLLYGDGLYETIAVRGGRVVRLDAHLARLRAGIRVLNFGTSIDSVDFGAAIPELCDAERLADARVRVTVTRGAGAPGDIVPTPPPEPTVIITADPLSQLAPKPARLEISSVRRDETSPLCAVKSLNCLHSAFARGEAVRKGFDDAILLNTAGNVAEATSSNVFLVSGDELVTPALDQGLLPGTVRGAVIGVARRLGLRVSERTVAPNELRQADGAFLTSAIQLIRPIRGVEETALDTDVALCERLREALLED